jgi:hypothetical protein
MGGVRRGRRKSVLRRAMVAAVAATLLLAAAAAGSAAAAPLSIRVDGNHFVNGEGQAIRLLGVDRTSSEYGCVDGFGYDDGHFDAADAAAIASWDANAVRVPLNEDCWLGINGQPNSNQGAEPPLTAAGYRQEIENYVADLNAHGIYAILDLHWTAPGNQVALEQQPMPDKDHSVAFWESVATAFKANPAVVFDLFNEPYDPTDPRSGEDQNANDKVTWECWETGRKPTLIGGGQTEPCLTQAYDESGNKTSRYEIAGMQSLVDAVRKTGATQPVMAGGLDYANDLSQWAGHAPDDPLNQEAASFHNYMGKACDNIACWESQIAPVAAAVPVVTGEFAEENYAEPGCVASRSGFDDEYMNWADAHGVSYLAWAWFVPDPVTVGEDTCSRYYLISDYSGTPASVNGIAVHTHLLALAAGGAGATGPGSGSGSGGGNGGSNGGSTGTGGGPKPGGAKIKLLRFRPKVLPGGKVSFQLEAAESCQATISGQTVKGYKLGGKKPRKVALGKGKIGLTADKPATVTIKLPAKGLHLLQSDGSLKARYTVTLSGGGNATTVAPHTLTLTEPHPK